MMTKFEVGKQYQTRCGEKAIVVFVGSPFMHGIPYPVIGWVDGEDEVTTWTSKGRFRADDEEHRLDLVSD